VALLYRLLENWLHEDVDVDLLPGLQNSNVGAHEKELRGGGLHLEGHPLGLAGIPDDQLFVDGTVERSLKEDTVAGLQGQFGFLLIRHLGIFILF